MSEMSRHPLNLTAGLLAAVFAGCVASQRQPGSVATAVGAQTAAVDGYGLSEATAVEVCKPIGEKQYLQRLRCADGTTPAFERRGSGGTCTPSRSEEEQKLGFEQMFREGPLKPGEKDYHIVDYFTVACGSVEMRVVMDMYHCHQPPPTDAPPGLSIAPVE